MQDFSAANFEAIRQKVDRLRAVRQMSLFEEDADQPAPATAVETPEITDLFAMTPEQRQAAKDALADSRTKQGRPAPMGRAKTAAERRERSKAYWQRLAEREEAERAQFDSKVEQKRTLHERLPAHMIDPVLTQPVNVPVAVMGCFYYLPTAETDVPFQKLTSETVGRIVAEGRKTRVLDKIPYMNPESTVVVGIIETRGTIPGAFPEGTWQRHPDTGREGLVIGHTEIDGGEASTLEFYSGEMPVAATRVWHQVQARRIAEKLAQYRAVHGVDPTGAERTAAVKEVDLNERLLAYMERHFDLIPTTTVEAITTAIASFRSNNHLYDEEKDETLRSIRSGEPASDVLGI